MELYTYPITVECEGPVESPYSLLYSAQAGTFPFRTQDEGRCARVQI